MNIMTPESINEFSRVISHRLSEPIGEFEICFTKYMGIGHRLYVFVSGFDETKIHAVCDQKIHPLQMLKQLKGSAKECKMIVVDQEMGGISTYK